VATPAQDLEQNDSDEDDDDDDDNKKDGEGEEDNLLGNGAIVRKVRDFFFLNGFAFRKVCLRVK